MVISGLLKILWGIIFLIIDFNYNHHEDTPTTEFKTTRNRPFKMATMIKVIVDSSAISCVSFEQLNEDFNYWLKNYYGVYC